MLPIRERFPVDDVDDAGSRESDQAALLELAERSAHGFNRDRQIVRDVVSRDW